jgi:hypothetical protein
LVFCFVLLLLLSPPPPPPPPPPLPNQGCMLGVRSVTQPTSVLWFNTKAGNTVTCCIMVYNSRFIIPTLPNKFARAVKLLLFVPEVCGSKLSLQKFSSFSQAVQATADIMP